MNKFGAVKAEVDGITFDSKAEARRYCTLRALDRAGKIADLQLQERFPIKINGALVCTYVADFTYTQGGARVVEDVKGVRTKEFRIKAKLMAAVHGIAIHEIPASAGSTRRRRTA